MATDGPRPPVEYTKINLETLIRLMINDYDWRVRSIQFRGKITIDDCENFVKITTKGTQRCWEEISVEIVT